MLHKLKKHTKHSLQDLTVLQEKMLFTKTVQTERKLITQNFWAMQKQANKYQNKGHIDVSLLLPQTRKCGIIFLW